MTRKARLTPEQSLRLVMHALGGRISIPLSALRDRLAGLSDNMALRIEAAGTGLRVQGEARALGAPIVFAARVDAEGIVVQGDQRTVRIRLSEVGLSTDDDAPGPLADAIRNGMIDTQNPATLIGNMLPLPEMIIEAEGRDIVIDLLKLPALARDEMLRAAVAAATSYLSVTGIEVADDAIELRLGILPGGPKEAVLSTARAALTPLIHYLWPEGRP
jgi:hypothetical protein